MRLALMLLFAFIPATGFAQDAGKVKERLMTPAGEIRITQLDEGELGNKFAVTLGDKPILQTDGGGNGQFSESPVPGILKHFNAVPPYDEVVVFQQHMWGNACDGGPIWFLGLKRDGSFDVSPPIDFCGGRPPAITHSAGRVIVTIPGGPRTEGGVTYPARRGSTRTVGSDNSNREGNLAGEDAAVRDRTTHKGDASKCSDCGDEPQISL